ncbi:hypothetical protein [Mangrovicella endophytica]|uniref:hypothetical protein n=1 Tax=Mangrovicella endophytica TaxID=2066697 RepID=UPI000C9EB0CA|nr:hypothetical protein [Mangrovicella endophytica]
MRPCTDDFRDDQAPIEGVLIEFADAPSPLGLISRLKKQNAALEAMRLALDHDLELDGPQMAAGNVRLVAV